MGVFDFLGDGRAVSGPEHRERKAQSRAIEEKSRSITSTEVFGATVGDSKVLDYIEEGYGLNPYVRRAIGLIASSVATLGIGVYDGKDRPVRVKESPAADLIAQPNPTRSNHAFIEALVSKLLLNGEVYPEVIRAGGDPNELTVMPDPREIDPQVSKDASEYITGYEHSRSGETWNPQQMHQMKLFHPKNDFKGQSLVKAAARAADVSNYGRKYMHALLKANGVPPHLIMLAGRLGPEEQENFEERFAQRALDAFLEMRADGLPKPQVMQDAGGSTVEPVGFSPSDMELIPSMQQAAREIAVAMGPAPELLGDPENKVYNNVQEARQALYHETAIPLAERITDELTGWLGEQFGFDRERHFGFTTEGVAALEGDPLRKRELDLEELQSGAITINEYRERQGMAPKEGGDVLLVGKSKQPLAVANQPSLEEEPQPQ